MRWVADHNADPRLAGPDAARNFEPYGQLGVVLQQDAGWHDQTGAPIEPQPGNIPGGARDVLRGADFSQGGTLEEHGFAPDSGAWAIQGGSLYVTADSLREDAVSVYHVDHQFPSYFEIQAFVKTERPTAGWKANAYIIFDYQSPTDFKFAGINVSTDWMEIMPSTAWL
jgi:hypothetical protein